MEPPPPNPSFKHPLVPQYPQGDAPPGRVSSLFQCTPSLAEDLLPVYSLFKTTPFVSSSFLPSVSDASASYFQFSIHHFSLFLLLFPHASLFHVIPSLFLLSLISLSLSLFFFFSPYISFSVWPRHPVVWKPAHPGPAPGALRTAPWVMGIVCSH